MPIDDSDDRRLALARAALPITQNCVYLNTAGVGPVSTTFSETLARCTEEDVRHGRALPERNRRIATARERIRSELAVVLGCEASRLTLTQSTSDGFARAVAAIRWEPGDEVVSTNIEHESCAAPLRLETARAGVALKIATVPPSAPDDLGWLTTLVTPRTRLIAFSGVGFETGVRLPIGAIAAFARQHGILSLMDAAQCAGAIELGLGTADIDFCAVPLQKWLCGPEGLGALYVSDAGRDALDRELRDSDRHGLGIVEATATHLEWMRESLGWNWIYRRIEALTRHARSFVAQTPSLALVDAGAFAGLSTVRCGAAKSAKGIAAIEDQALTLRHFPEAGAWRIATSFMNTRQEIEGVLGRMAQLSG